MTVSPSSPSPERERQASGGGISRWPLGWTLAGALGLAGGAAFGAYEWFVARLPINLAEGLTPTQLLTGSLAVPAAVGATVALVVNIRKQDLAERTAAFTEQQYADTQAREAETRDREREAAFTDRFRAASTQLGAAAPAERIAGVYAMAALADDYPARRQECVDVLCGYLRLPYDPELDDIAVTSTTVAANGTSTTTTPARRPHDTQVRSTIISLIRQHTLNPDTPTSWSSLSFSLTRAHLHDLNLTGVTFSGPLTSFREATFSGSLTSFRGASFSGSVVTFYKATFSGDDTWFNEATFSGPSTSFLHATFSGARTLFDGATFSGAHTWFLKATFSGDLTSFEGATFSGPGTWFNGATFSGAYPSFEGATFSGAHTSFDEATFSAPVPPEIEAVRQRGTRSASEEGEGEGDTN